jgi:hypothetical protein
MKRSFTSRATLRLATMVALLTASWQAGFAQGAGPSRVSRPTFEGDNVRFDWNSGGELQIGPSPQGPWTTVTNPQARNSTTTVPFREGNFFFRVLERGIPGEPESIVQGDPRRPFRIRTAFIRRAQTERGNAILEATLQPGQNPPPIITFLNESSVITLRDDGTNGDARAGDGTFTGPMVVDLDDFAGANQFFRSLPPAFQVQGFFSGRGLEAEHDLTVFDSDAFNRGDRVQVFPSPFEGFGILQDGGTNRPGALNKSLTLRLKTGTDGQPARPVIRTNTICTTNLVTTNIQVGVRPPGLATNIDCRTLVSATNIFVGNEPGSTNVRVDCFPIVTETNVVVGFQPRFVTRVDCRDVVIRPGQEPVITNVCTTNFVPRLRPVVTVTPVTVIEFVERVITEVVCPTNTPIIRTNVASVAAFKTDAVALDCVTNTVVIQVPIEITREVVTTNLVEELVPVVDCRRVVVQPGQPPFVDVICVTNQVPVGDPLPIVTNIVLTNIFCRTNVVITPPRPIFREELLTNRLCFTNIFEVGEPTPIFETRTLTNIDCRTVVVTNILGGGITITNVDGDIIIFTNGVPPGQGGLNDRPIFWNRSLMITDLSVVDDPSRTFDPCTGRGTRMGAWTFGRLMSDMCNQPVTGINPGDFARRWVRSWQMDQVINFDTVTNRNPEILAQVINDWEAASGGPDRPLDMSIAPFRLLAIVNRVDLRGNPGYGVTASDDPCNPSNVGGEGRFVFGLIPDAFRGGRGGTQPPSGYGGGGGGGSTNNICDAAQFTVIFEYGVPKRTCQEIKDYGMQWYLLSRMEFGAAFNAALQAITDQFAAAGADPSRKPNLSALSQLRANELLREPWDMREWRLFSNDSDAGWLREVTAKQTPSITHNFRPIIAEYALANAFDILREQHTVPLQWRTPGKPMVPFLGGDAPMVTQAFFWDGPPPVASSLPTNLRHKFSLNTCNGCHAGETGTPFTHVFPRRAGEEARLSDFLTGANMPKIDPADGVTPHWFSDLRRREDDLLRLVTEPCFFQLFRHPAQFSH